MREPSPSDPRHRLSGALHAWLGAIADTDTELFGESDGTQDEASVAAGYRYLTGMVRWTLTRAFLGRDPDEPRFVRCMDDISKWGLENPDTVYRVAEISPHRTYRVSGTSVGCRDLNIEILTGLAGDVPGSFGSRLAALGLAQMRLAADGQFEVRVGGERTGDNWLPIAPDARTVFVRQTVSDWGRGRAAPLSIETVDAAGTTPGPDGAGAVAAKMDDAARLLRGQTAIFRKLAQDWGETMPLNAVTAPVTGGAVGSCPGQYHSCGRFRIGDAEALVVSFARSDAAYQGVVAGHAAWFVSHDYRATHCSLSGDQSRVSSDGRYYFVLSHRDPGHPNWIDIGSQPSGFLFLRWQGVQDLPPSDIEAGLVAFDQLAAALPADEPTIDAAARASVIAARRNAVDRRFG